MRWLLDLVRRVQGEAVGRSRYDVGVNGATLTITRLIVGMCSAVVIVAYPRTALADCRGALKDSPDATQRAARLFSGTVIDNASDRDGVFMGFARPSWRASHPFLHGAQAPAALTGTVTDSTKAPLPGVTVTVVTNSLERTALTGADGRYRFPGLPAGTYRVQAELAGFETAVERGIVVGSGAATPLHFTLQVGCMSEAIRVDMGFARTLREATAVVQIRISASGSGEPCSATGFCVCTEHVATVERVLKAGPPDVSLTTIRFLQEGAGRIAENGRHGSETPYALGQEFVAYLRWDPAANLFVRMGGPMYMFPVRDGRVEFRRTDAPGLSDAMLVEEFSRALQASVTAR